MSTNAAELLSLAQSTRDSNPAQAEQLFKQILAFKAGEQSSKQGLISYNLTRVYVQRIAIQIPFVIKRLLWSRSESYTVIKGAGHKCLLDSRINTLIGNLLNSKRFS
jgi:hypothetical protein